MQVPVKDEQGHIRLLHVTMETVYLQTECKGELVFHTEHGTYTLIRRMEDWAYLLESETDDFLRVDRGTIVNLRIPWQFDHELRVLELQHDRGMIRIPVSERKVSEIKDRIRARRNRVNRS